MIFFIKELIDVLSVVMMNFLFIGQDAKLDAELIRADFFV